jgi:hypothetical protein
MDTARISFNEAIHVLAAGHNNELAAQALAIHRQRDKSEAALKMELCMLKERHSLLSTGYEALAKENAELKMQVAALDALVSERAAIAEQQAYDDLSGSVIAEEAAAYAAYSEEELIDLTGESEAEGSAPQEGGEAPAAKKRADARIFAKLAAVLPEGTPLSLTSTGDRWDGAYTKDGLIFQDKAFKSPLAVTKAHAERITERHPKSTKPGSGWLWLKVEDGPYKGKTLGQAYDAHYA